MALRKKSIQYKMYRKQQSTMICAIGYNRKDSLSMAFFSIFHLFSYIYPFGYFRRGTSSAHSAAQVKRPYLQVYAICMRRQSQFSSSVMSGSLQSMFGVLHRLDLGFTSHPNDAALPHLVTHKSTAAQCPGRGSNPDRCRGRRVLYPLTYIPAQFYQKYLILLNISGFAKISARTDKQTNRNTRSRQTRK